MLRTVIQTINMFLDVLIAAVGISIQTTMVGQSISFMKMFGQGSGVTGIYISRYNSKPSENSGGWMSWTGGNQSVA